MRLNTSNFHGFWNKAISKGSEAWTELTKLYAWSKKNLSDIQREWPEYTIEWAKKQIMRVYNLDPDFLPCIAAKLGGGSDEESIEKGLKIISRVGISEASRAAACIPRAKWNKVASEVSAATGPDSLRKITDEVMAESRAELSAAAKKLSAVSHSRQTGKTIGDYIKENDLLRKENAALKARVKDLEAMLAKMKALVA